MTDQEQHEKKVYLASETKPEIDQAELEALLKTVDKESTARKVTGVDHWVVYVIAVAFSTFQIYTAAFGLLPAQLQRSIHLAFAFVLVFLLYGWTVKRKSDKLHWHDYLMAGFAGFIGLYFTINYTRIMESGGDYTSTDYFFACIGVLVTMEAARRVVGVPIVMIAGFFVVYAYLGPYFPGFMAHRGYSVQRIASHLYLTTEGIFGIPLWVSSTFIYLFVVFGAFREKTGLGQLFIDLSNAVAGWASGGPAKVAVVTSALEGMISGSSVANTVESGSFTIPMMKKLGYRPEFAGAVEASASTGGQIMPPVMGAAAFLMAEFLGMPYLEIAKAAAIPACLYFTGIFIEVHFEAKRSKLRGLSRDELPKLSVVMLERGHLLFPLFAIIFFLGAGFTPLYAALMGLVVCVVAAQLRKSTRMGIVDVLNAFAAGARGALGVAIACACAGIIIGVVTLTGLGLKLANGLVDLAGGNLLLTLMFTMVTSLILGMGAPTTANYIITSTIAAPALIMLGVPPLAAHMFVFYFGIIADLTPPVALAAYAGAGIAKADPMKTGWIATKLAIGAFIVPYIFVYNPAMLLIGTTPLGLTQDLTMAILGMTAIGAAMIGFCLAPMTWFERPWFFIAGLLMVDPGLVTDIIGIVMLTIGLAIQWRKKKIWVAAGSPVAAT